MTVANYQLIKTTQMFEGGADPSVVNADRVDAVMVDGKEIMAGPIEWATSNSATAAAVAAAINVYASNPKYVAVSIGDTVYVAPKVVRSDDPSELTLQVRMTGGATGGTGAPPPEGPPGGGGGGIDPRDKFDSGRIFEQER